MVDLSARRLRLIALPLMNLLLLAACANQPSTFDAARGPAVGAEALGLSAIYPLQADVVPGQIWLQPAERGAGAQRGRRRATGTATVVSQVPPPADQEAAAQRDASLRSRARQRATGRRQNLAQLAPAAGPNGRVRRSGLVASSPRRAAEPNASIAPISSSTLVPVAASAAPTAPPRDDIMQRPQLVGSAGAGPVRLLEAELGAGGPLAPVQAALGFARNADAIVSMTVPSALFLQAVHRDIRREAEDFIHCNPQIFNRSRLLESQSGAARIAATPMVTVPTTIYYTTSLEYNFREAPRRVGVRPYTQMRASAEARANAQLLYAMLREHPDLRAKLESAALERPGDQVVLDGGPNPPSARSVTLTAQFDRPVAWAYLGVSYEIFNTQATLSAIEATYCEAVAAARRDRREPPAIPPELARLRADKLRPASAPSPRTTLDMGRVASASRRTGLGRSIVTLAHLPS